ncbi:DUF2568 domain-containing protein [Leucobacter sp. USHLN153]|uniref:DUF2568 domain-containing protein n=1 Tax=Leucobacter sp. USHLN153 TaxID=3081268 RepID=UPI003018F249
MTGNTPDAAPRSASPALMLARGLFQLAAIITVTVWGFLAWPLPFPGILTGLGLLALCVLLWALFLSPKPVLRVDRFAQALFELCLFAAAVAALLALGVFWVWAAVLGIVGAAIGFIASSRAR